jgi:hypothetical protein
MREEFKVKIEESGGGLVFFSGWCRLSFGAPQVSQGIRKPTLTPPMRGSNWLKGLGPRVEGEKKEFPGLPPPRNLHYIKPYSLAA